MRKLMFLLSLAVLCSFALLVTQGRPAQGQSNDKDDHDDQAPVQAGYAVVTSAGTAGGMVVFETFGMRHANQDATQAGVLPPDLTTNAILFVDSSGRLSKNLGVAIVDPSTSQDANVTLTLRNSAGTTLGSATVAVMHGQQTSKFFTELFAGQSSVPRDVTGTLAIVSNTPVSVIGLRFRGANFSTLPVTNLSPISAPAGTVILPQFAAGGGWATELVIANTSTSTMTATVNLFKPDGTPLTTALNNHTGSSFTNISIPAGGVYVLAPRNGNGDDDF